MNQQLQRITTKLEQLRNLDIHFQLFGAHHHQYQLNPPLAIETIQHFEQQYQIILPKDYVAFLIQIGNGGAGPFLGLEPFEHALFVDLDYPNPQLLLNPHLPFPHQQAWNVMFSATCDEDDEHYERQYFEFHSHQMDGCIAICNYGCGVSLNLVVNGAEYGYVWTDDRANDGGIYPAQELGNTEKLSFLDWYELWLDQSLLEIHEQLTPTHADLDDGTDLEKSAPLMTTTQKWWKFW
ncbi:SMI1/KNR4 family protein [Acinetobacter sp. CFCC 10889]|uniref:SMI1/KNR4 family protein n=1 Tax=Acinetobacter sp. CFCC 10889 TaxID=1775557 RepID=UPI000DCFF203|nr:SMI1/KNR4 family protein [Acinetobacter sp. CFCC 10889]